MKKIVSDWMKNRRMQGIFWKFISELQLFGGFSKVKKAHTNIHNNQMPTLIVFN